MSDNEEIKKSVDAFQSLAKAFGPDDIYSRIILEEVFRAIMNFTDDEEIEEKEKNGNNK